MEETGPSDLNTVLSPRPVLWGLLGSMSLGPESHAGAPGGYHLLPNLGCE